MTDIASLSAFASFPVEIQDAARRFDALRAGDLGGQGVPGLTRMKEGSEGSETSETSENSENSERSEFSEGSEFGERSTPGASSGYGGSSANLSSVPVGEWGPVVLPVSRD
ncbi:hypothetical protein ACFC00_04905 [Streptomyces adustus]|uniref:hypothetical protein n=1 Tax=Streptomyces adustus TaxID=1609272 RepID=UPI0035E32844